MFTFIQKIKKRFIMNSTKDSKNKVYYFDTKYDV